MGKSSLWLRASSNQSKFKSRIKDEHCLKYLQERETWWNEAYPVKTLQKVHLRTSKGYEIIRFTCKHSNKVRTTQFFVERAGWRIISGR